MLEQRFWPRLQALQALRRRNCWDEALQLSRTFDTSISQTIPHHPLHPLYLMCQMALAGDFSPFRISPRRIAESLLRRRAPAAFRVQGSGMQDIHKRITGWTAPLSLKPPLIPTCLLRVLCSKDALVMLSINMASDSRQWDRALQLLQAHHLRVHGFIWIHMDTSE